MLNKEWQTVSLGKVVTLHRGFDLPYRERRPGLIPIVTSSGIGDTHAESRVTGPGVVTGRYGTIGEVFFIEQDFWPLNTTLFVEDFHGNDPLFVSYLLRTIDFHSHSGKSGVPGVNRNDLHGLEVSRPPLREQRAIAGALSDVDALIDALTQLTAKKRDLKQAAMQQLLTGQTRLPGFSREWEVKRLGDVAALNRMNVIPASSPDQLFDHFSLPAFDAGKVPVVEPGSAIGSNKFRVPQDAILVSKLNPRIPRVWAPTEIPAEAIASTEFLVLTAKEGVSRSFLYVICSSPSFCEQMELSATGTTGSHQRISPTGALGLTVSVPVDVDEQTAIAAVRSDIDAELAALEQRLAKTRALKQGVMQELLTGRTRLV